MPHNFFQRRGSTQLVRALKGQEDSSDPGLETRVLLEDIEKKRLKGMTGSAKQALKGQEDSSDPGLETGVLLEAIEKKRLKGMMSSARQALKISRKKAGAMFFNITGLKPSAVIDIVAVAVATCITEIKALKISRKKAGAMFFNITGLKPSAELLAIGMVYFVQGILGLSRLALSFFFKDTLDVEPAQDTLDVEPAQDTLDVKPAQELARGACWLPLSTALELARGAGSWCLLATSVDSPSSAVGAMVLASLGTAFSDVVVDSIVVERARGEPQWWWCVWAVVLASLVTAFSDVVVDSIVVERARGEPQATSGSLQSLCWASSAMGGIISAYFSGSLVETYGTRFVFGVTALFPLIVSASALLINEKRTPILNGSGGGGGGSGGAGDDSCLPVTLTLAENIGSRTAKLWETVKRPNILMPIIFVLMWQATPSSESAMFFFQTNELGFTAEFLGRVRLAGAVASLIGVALYNTTLKRVPLRKMLTWCMILGVLLGSTTLILVSGLNRQLGLSDQLFVLGDSVILTVLGQVSFMPILVLAARICPEASTTSSY
eukprot:gene15797-21921_t